MAIVNCALGKLGKKSGFVFSIRIPWFVKSQDFMPQIFSNRTNSKQEKIRPFVLMQLQWLDFTSLAVVCPPLTRKSLTRFPLPWFLAYVGELALVGDHSAVPLTQISCNTVFFKSQNARKTGTLCMPKWSGNPQETPRFLY